MTENSELATLDGYGSGFGYGYERVAPGDLVLRVTTHGQSLLHVVVPRQRQ